MKIWQGIFSVSVPPVCWSRLARCHVTSVRMDTQEQTVRGEDEWQIDPPIRSSVPTVIPVSVSRCASGFYGNPQVVGGACVRCECHGNVNISEAGYCDIITGECLRCLGNTAGRHCEVCQPGYYGDAIHTKNCQGETHTYTHIQFNITGGGGVLSFYSTTTQWPSLGL